MEELLKDILILNGLVVLSEELGIEESEVTSGIDKDTFNRLAKEFDPQYNDTVLMKKVMIEEMTKRFTDLYEKLLTM